MNLPKHKCGLYIRHNEHKCYHETLDLEYMVSRQLIEDFENPAEMEKAISEDSLWTLQWYPDTSVGFYRVAASTLEKCLELAANIDQEVEK